MQLINLGINKSWQVSACQNHVRVYKRIPGTDSSVLVCGTQASISPECRIIQVILNINFFIRIQAM